ncbi:putative phenylacetate-CoA ligase [Planktothrix serta PCC 8927]|uniref:Phenylacetate-CoA ligase n=2 Tax=Planktothrix TaxID=54304 RepID=A0A7Z9C1T2_9CYAN|nr:putative phenylacetate-CoA ligase [Planktothrix serta PCC 8927]
MGQLRDEQRQRAISALNGFLSTPLSDLLQPSTDRGVTSVLQLFQEIVTTVPAYQQFLAANDRSIHDIQTLEDFQTLPLITKENYLRQYSLSQLCRHGQLETCDLIAVSSGSTGKPTFWPRFISDELQIATRFEQIFYDSFQADQRRTLAVICFTLGTWVGGMYTTACCRHLATKGYPITVITPGNQKPEIFRVIRELGEQFEQVVLLGYPPFIKDVIDTGIAEGMEWQKYQVKLVFAGEVFSEEWRSLVGERVGSTQLNYDSASLYGTADAGVLGNETPLSICIRRFLAEHPDIAKQLFGESRLPTLVQYDPNSRFFEMENEEDSTTGTLLFSGDNGIPLIRYYIADQGGIIEFQQMLDFLKQWDFDPISELQKTGNRGIHQLPFVFVFGRSQFIISYFGANIYPENVTVGLEQPLIKDWVTGKFVMSVIEDTDQNRFLSVVVELAPGIAETEEKKAAIADSILTQLKRLNSEFANYVPPEYQTPKITLKLTGDPEYFPLGVKHRYTRKN